MEKSIGKNGKNILTPMVRGVLVGVCVSVVGVLLLALLYRFVSMSEMTIRIVNQVIKVLSLFVASFVALKKERSRVLVKGLIVGALYTILSYTIFSVLSSTFTFGINFIFDLIFGSVIGSICAYIYASMRR